MNTNGFYFGVVIDLPAPGWETVTLHDARVEMAELEEDFEGSELARTDNAKHIIDVLQSREGVTCEALTTIKDVSVCGYLASWHEYCLYVEAVLLLFVAATKAGSTARAALCADITSVTDHPIFQLYKVEHGKIVVDRPSFDDYDEATTLSLLAEHGLDVAQVDNLRA